MREVRVGVRLLSGGGVAGPFNTVAGDDMGRGSGSVWSEALVQILHLPGKRQIMVTMDVPKNLDSIVDSAVIERFVQGFNGGKVNQQK